MKSKNNFVTLKVAKALKIDSLSLTKGEKIKALFIVSQTNYYGVYDVYVNKFKKLMGVNTVELDRIFNELVSKGIIKLVQAGKYKEQCRSYAMVTPFDVAKDDCDVVSFQFEAPGTPVFINRFIADGFTYKDNSTYKPRTKTAESDAKDAIIATLQARIAELEALLSTQVPAPVQPIKIAETFEVPAPDTVPIQLTPNLIIEPFKDTLGIILGNRMACIENFELMSGWAERMPEKDQIRLYTAIVNEPGKSFKFWLNKTTTARFTKEDVGGIFSVWYQSVQAA